MRDVLIDEEQKLSVRGLTRTELRKLKKDGFDPLDMIVAKSTEIYDAVFDIILTKEEFDSLEDKENKWAVGVFRGIMAETFGQGEETKNS